MSSIHLKSRENSDVIVQHNSIILPNIKGAVHPKMKLLSSFIHPQVVSNLYGSLSSVEHKRKY